MLCMPIHDASPSADEESQPGRQNRSGSILGVISLLEKDLSGRFTENDERFLEAFAIFCGMAIRNAAEYERAVVSEAKLKVRNLV